ncbi:MAG: hypothetical protein ACI952_000226, partial [Flavobacteriales bacterium]
YKTDIKKHSTNKLDECFYEYKNVLSEV